MLQSGPSILRWPAVLCTSFMGWKEERPAKWPKYSPVARSLVYLFYGLEGGATCKVAQSFSGGPQSCVPLLWVGRRSDLQSGPSILRWPAVLCTCFMGWKEERPAKWPKHSPVARSLVYLFYGLEGGATCKVAQSFSGGPQSCVPLLWVGRRSDLQSGPIILRWPAVLCTSFMGWKEERPAKWPKHSPVARSLVYLFYGLEGGATCKVAQAFSGGPQSCVPLLWVGRRSDLQSGPIILRWPAVLCTSFMGWKEERPAKWPKHSPVARSLVYLFYGLEGGATCKVAQAFSGGPQSCVPHLWVGRRSDLQSGPIILRWPVVLCTSLMGWKEERPAKWPKHSPVARSLVYLFYGLEGGATCKVAQSFSGGPQSCVPLLWVGRRSDLQSGPSILRWPAVLCTSFMGWKEERPAKWPNHSPVTRSLVYLFYGLEGGATCKVAQAFSGDPQSCVPLQNLTFRLHWNVCE